MNLILFQLHETTRPLPRQDPRAGHLLDVLRRQPGDTFDAGLIDGPHGKGTLVAITADRVELTFAWGPAPPPLDPITLLIGLPRPQTARKILQEASALGVAALHFVRTERGEPSYADSTLWHSGEWQRHVQAGVAQAFCTRLPVVSSGRSLSDLLDTLPVQTNRIALDNYESVTALSQCPLVHDQPVVAALGAERGWSADEREQLRRARFTLAHLGSRVLRLETAVVATLAVLKTRLGSM